MANQSRVKRKKFNLVRHKMGKKSMDDMIWFIGLRRNRKTFYVADYDDDNNSVMWSEKKENGISFKSEQAIHRFIHRHLNNRSDIFLIHAPSD